jgi:hypothetical protein
VLAQPSLIDFPQTGANLLSSPVTVTLTNPSGTSSLSSFALAVTTGFKLVSNTCPATLAAGASCTTAVEFAPTSAGPASGSLTVSSSALPTGTSVPLTGLGFDFAVTPSGNSSIAIANGQTADFKLVLTPIIGGQGVFTLACGTLPPYSSCTFNPGTEGIPANTTGSELVEIATGLNVTSVRLARPSRSFAWPALPLACGLMLLPLALRRRKLLLVLLLATLAGCFSGCTESGGGLPSLPPPNTPGITPAGTYPIIVTVTANGVAHPITLTLTVD